MKGDQTPNLYAFNGLKYRSPNNVYKILHHRYKTKTETLIRLYFKSLWHSLINRNSCTTFERKRERDKRNARNRLTKIGFNARYNARALFSV